MTCSAPKAVGTTNARLAAAVACFIKSEETLVATCEAVRANHEADTTDLPSQIEARNAAFNTLKTIFETEFPHV